MINKQKQHKKTSMQSNSRQTQILGILVIAISLLVLASLVGYMPYEEPMGISPDIKIENPMGILGVYIGYSLIKVGFGYLTVLIPILGIIAGWFLFAQKKFDRLSIISIFVFTFIILGSITIGLVNRFYALTFLSGYNTPGLAGSQLSALLFDFLGGYGSFIIVFAGWLIWGRGVFSWDFYAPFRMLGEKWAQYKIDKKNKDSSKKEEDAKRKHTEELVSKIDSNKDDKLEQEKLAQLDISLDQIESDDQELNKGEVEEIDMPPIADKIEDYSSVTAEELLNEEYIETPLSDQISDDENEEDINVGEMVVEKEVELDKAKKQQTPRKKFQLPTTDLLTQPVETADALTRDELVDRANFLTESLSTFGVEGKVVNVHPGPVITLFEVEPAEGVRVNKFVALSDDLARVMEANRVRVIAPIPGKSSVGIEIPNRNPATVFFKSVINSSLFVESKSKLTLAVGKTTSGEIAILDLAKMPHLLIAGTTGSGKSVCLNTIICSIIYQATPEEVKFMIIDPKKVEMTLYRALDGYHLLKTVDIDEPIVTNTDNSILALRALEKEMDRRYNVLADAVVRNIGEYNEKARKNKESIMPFIVLVVDELADLMMLSAKDVEAPIARLAQLARAVGIHLVIATQRPSVDVITGVIKANFPARIAFQVASKIDSRTILDTSGAEKLIGRGDMLVIQPGSSEPVRLHNAYVSLEEIQAIMEHVMTQDNSEDLVLESVREASNADSFLDDSDDDELLNEAIKLVVMHQQGSISLLQRRLKVGYSRAARLIDAMENIRVVGPFTGSKAREVLVDELYLQTLD